VWRSITSTLEMGYAGHLPWAMTRRHTAHTVLHGRTHHRLRTRRGREGRRRTRRPRQALRTLTACRLASMPIGKLPGSAILLPGLDTGPDTAGSRLPSAAGSVCVSLSSFRHTLGTRYPTPSMTTTTTCGSTASSKTFQENRAAKRRPTCSTKTDSFGTRILQGMSSVPVN
jgi:hypothetical protein